MSMTGVVDVIDYDEDSRNIEGDTGSSVRMVQQCSIGVNANLPYGESSG